MKNKVLICGASGYIGRNIYRDMEQNGQYEVYGTYLNGQNWNGKLIRADLTDISDLQMLFSEKWNTIVNAAAITGGYGAILANPLNYIPENTVLNTRLGQFSVRNKVPFFIFMSCCVLYPQFLGRPVTETDEVFNVENGLHSEYFGSAWMKLQAENLYRYLSQKSDTKFTIVRHSNIFGEDDNYDSKRSHVMAATIDKILRANDGDEIIIWGEGKEKRDFLFVREMTEFIRLAIRDLEKRESGFEVYNVGAGTSHSIKEIVELVASTAGKKLKINFDKSKPTINSELELNIKKAESLGWSPNLSINESIKLTIAWYKDHILH